MPIQTQFDTGWLCLISLVLFIYYLICKIQPLVELVDHFITVGLNQTFDTIQRFSKVVRRSRLYSTFHKRVLRSTGSCGMGHHRWKLCACKHSNLIVTIVHLVVTVAINCTRFVHDQAPRGNNRSTFVLRGALEKRTIHLTLTDGSGGGLNERQVIQN